MKLRLPARLKACVQAVIRVAALPVILLGLLGAIVLAAQMTITRQSNGEMTLSQATAAGEFHRIETSQDLQQWTPLMTLQSTGTSIQHVDSAAPYLPQKRYYRSSQLTGPGILTGDHIATSAGEVVIHPVNHASFVMSWNGKMIYSDPVGSTTLYSGFPKADLILVTHSHTDHYSNTTLAGVLNTSTGKIIAPQAVYSGMTSSLKTYTTVMLTGQTPPTNNTPPQTVIGITIEGVPAYNSNHPYGTCNAYVLTIGDKRFFISGDTGDTPEMRALQNIDVAFVCMNTPYTMDLATAVSVVRAFKPKIVVPYHFRNSDNTYTNLPSFKSMVGTDLGIEVRIRTWY